MVKKRASNSDGVGGPIGPQQLYAAAKAALSMARTILESLPIKGEARLKSDINVIDQWFQSAGEDYTTFERIRNPERLPWPGMGLGTYHVAAPSSKAVAHFHELCEAMARICESYQWQGISDGSRIPHSMQRYGTALIPEVNVAFVCSVAIAAQGLSEDLNPTDTDGRQWVGNLVAAAETLARAEANIEPPKPVEPQAKFVFRPDGDGYFLNGFGESGHFTTKGAKGLHDLFRLVQTPGVPVPMLEIDSGPGVERAEGDGRSRQLVADGETFKQLAAKRKQLKADIESAGSDMERGELEAELAKLEETAKGMKGLKGKPRDLNNPLDKLRPKLLKRISTAGDRLREANLNKLADHFGLTVSSESGCLVYRPAIDGLTWNVAKL